MSNEGNLKTDPAYNSRHKNPTSLKESYDKIIDITDGKEQLESNNNDVDVRAISEGIQKDSMKAINGDSQLKGENEYSAGTKGDIETQNLHYSEMNRFSKEHDVITTKENTLRDVLKMKSDNPSD